MKLFEAAESLAEYEAAFDSFVKTYQLPNSMFRSPDHVAIKCANQIDYFETCRELGYEADSEGIWEMQMDGRMLASARLAGHISVGNSNFSLIEIMQPKPGKEIPVGFVEHTEFYEPDFFSVERILDQRGIIYTPQQNEGHKWLNIPIDGEGRELKINDKPLGEVVEIEKMSGLLHQIVRED